MSNVLSSIPIFAPTQISGCQLWLDGADSSTIISSGSNVSLWRDKSANANNAQTSLGTPTLQTIGGLQGIYFSADTVQMTTISNNATIGNAARSFFCVARTATSSSILRIGTGNHTVGASPTSFGIDIDPGTTQLFAPYTYSTDNNIISVALTGTNIVYADYNSSAVTVAGSYNGGSLQTKATAALSTTTSVWYIGRRPDNGGCTAATFYEIIHYSSVLSTGQRQQVEGYLAWKWGLQGSLPSNHPYKNSQIYPTTSLPVQFRSNLATIPLGSSTTPFSFINPTSIPTCSLWLDPSDITTLYQNTSLTTPITADGQTIQGIQNKAAANSATGSSGPIFKANIQNGLNVMRYNGSQSLTTSGYTFTTTNVSIFAIGLLTSTASGYYKSIIYGSPDQIIYFGSGNGSFLTFSQGNWGSGNSPDVSILNSCSLLELLISGTVLTPYLNGTSQSTKTATSPRSAVTSLSIGGTANWIGDIGEILIYDSALSTTQRQQVEGYLAWKWGIQASLPASHPYKNTVPGLSIPVVPTSRQMTYRAFGPLSFSGNVLWLDANDTATMTFSGTNLTRWNDKSPLAMYATPSNSNVFLSNTGSYIGMYINNNNNGSAPGTTLLSLNSNFMTTSNYSIFATFQYTSSTLYQTLYSDNRTTSESRIQIGETQSFDFLADGTTIRAVNISLGTSRQQICATTSSNGLFIYQNGSLIGSNTTTGATYTTDAGALPTIGGPSISPADNRFMTGWIFEMVMYSSVLPVQQRQSVEGYLAWKWGIQGSLPAGHPYRLFPPPPS